MTLPNGLLQQKSGLARWCQLRCWVRPVGLMPRSSLPAWSVSSVSLMWHTCLETPYHLVLGATLLLQRQLFHSLGHERLHIKIRQGPVANRYDIACEPCIGCVYVLFLPTSCAGLCCLCHPWAKWTVCFILYAARVISFGREKSNLLSTVFWMQFGFVTIYLAPNHGSQHMHWTFSCQARCSNEIDKMAC